MKKYIYILPLLILSIIFSGCSTKYTPYKEAKTGVMVYKVGYKKASQLIYTAIKQEFPKLVVKQTKEKDGYFVDYKLMTDKQRYTIKLKQLRGNVNHRLVDGLSFEVYSEGTMFISAQSRKKLFLNALDKFNSTLRGVIVQNAIPIKLRSTKQNIHKIATYHTPVEKKFVYVPIVNKSSKNCETSKIKVQVKKVPTLETKLQNALILYHSGLINNHEYYNMRQKIIAQN